MTFRNEDHIYDVNDTYPINSAAATSVNVHEATPAADAMHGDKNIVYGDTSYHDMVKGMEMAGMTAEFRLAILPGKRRGLPNTPEERLQELIEVAKSHIRSKVEHPFRVIKQQFYFQKSRLPGLDKKNGSKLNVLAALTTLLLARRQPLATGRTQV